MTAGGDVGGYVEADVVAAGQERGNHRDGSVGWQRPKHVGGRRPEHVDESDVHLPLEQVGHPMRQSPIIATPAALRVPWATSNKLIAPAPPVRRPEAGSRA